MDRDLTDRERAVLAVFAEDDEAGAGWLGEALPHLRGTYGCACGCESFGVRDVRVPSAAAPLVMWLPFCTEDRTSFVLLWLDDYGHARAVELVGHDQARLPDPETLVPWVPSPSPETWLSMSRARREMLAGRAGYPETPETPYDGFRLCLAIDGACEPKRLGRAVVTAPDGSAAAVRWEAGVTWYVRELRAPDDRQWGVWAIGLPRTITGWSDNVTFFADVMSELRPRWEAWRRSQDQIG